MTRPVYWPCDVLPPTSHTLPWPEHSTRSGGRSEGGIVRQRQRDPFWRMKYEAPLRGAAQVRLAQTLLLPTLNRNAPLSFPIFGCGRGPGADAFRLPNAEVPHDDDAGFDDGSFYEGTIYPASFASGAALRATRVSLLVEYGPDRILPTHYLTIGERLNQIRAVVSVSGLVVTVDLVTPLREAVSAGTRVEFDRPRGLFYIENADAAAINLQMNRFATLSLDLIEAV